MRRAWLLVLLLAGAAPAAAGPRDDAARELDAGVARYRAADYAGALGRFQRAYRLLPSDKILFNLALTFDVLGRDADAAQAFELYLHSAPRARSRDQRARAARAALDRLHARVGRLVFAEALAGAAITVDGAPVVLPHHRRLYVAPGRHTIVVAFSGLVRHRLVVAVGAGQLRGVGDGIVAPGGPSDRPAPPRRRAWTWLAAGAALGLTAGAMIFSDWR